VRAILFAAVGTAGQRCTSLRRLFVHADIYDRLVPRLVRAYASVTVGDPRDGATLVGPLIDAPAYEAMQAALAEAHAQGGSVHGGERLLADRFPDAFYVRPAIAEMPAQTAIVLRETFAPILFVIRYDNADEALSWHNAVPQACPRPSSPTTCASRAFPVVGGQRLRHRQRQHRPQRGGDRRRVRRREGNRRRARIRLRRLARLHAARHQHGELFRALPLARGYGSTSRAEGGTVTGRGL